MILYYKGISSIYETENVVRIFYPQAALLNKQREKAEKAYCFVRQTGGKLFIGVCINSKKSWRTFSLPQNNVELLITQTLFGMLSSVTGYVPEWGMLTGVRPVSFLRSFFEKGYAEKKVEKIFKNNYFLQEEKYSIALQIMKKQDELIAKASHNAYSLYISIPFCPSRCSYCSFVSQTTSAEGHLIPAYIKALCKELEDTAIIAEQLGLRLETVYMGGGTPTSISAEQLTHIFNTLHRCFPMKNIKEFTVEAGRPDTITEEKLLVIKNAGATRISINPQTLNDEVLAEISRPHKAEDFVKAFQLARRMGFDNINTDLIAGLPKDTVEGFEKTIQDIIKLKPENVTVHTLTLKRASKIVIDGTAEKNLQENVAAMLQKRQVLLQHGYFPYYLYRQKGTLQNLENIGYSLRGKEGLYNIFIMEEVHTVLSCGAGGSTKLKAPNGKKISRMFNHKYPSDYINDSSKLQEKNGKIVHFFSCEK